MCGRYLIDDEAYADILTILYKADSISGMFSAAPVAARGEIFPTNFAPVFKSDGAAAVKWGFPHWKSSNVIINARSETALEKPMFRKSLLDRRCVIPSSGFYEWKRTGERYGKNRGDKKEKYLLRIPDENKLYMAGFWNEFKDITGASYSAFNILTTAANDSVAEIHDRMPVILSEDEKDYWINDLGFMQHVMERQGPELEAIVA